MALVAEEEPAGDLVRPPGPQGVEPVHQLLVMPSLENKLKFPIWLYNFQGLGFVFFMHTDPASF